MVTSRVELSTKMLSTFNMTKVIWTSKNIKNSWAKMAQIHYIRN
jgi:hypothetical protein